jgi:site-specific DNA-methyltransferase (adenine-specific)
MNLFNIDCILGSQKYIQSNSIDLIICDPPFGIGENSFEKHYKRKKEKVLNGYCEAPDDYLKFSYNWIHECNRILKNNGSMYIFSGYTNLNNILDVVNKLNLYLINHIIWKYNFGVNTKNKYVSSHYHILYLKKDKNVKVTFNTNCRFGFDEKDEDGKSLLYKDLEDVWIINKEYQQGKEKNINKLPEELIKKIILYSSNENDTICDFFLGNFTTAIVAKKLGRHCYGFEINENIFNFSMNKLNKIEFRQDLANLRVILPSKYENRGKRISEEELKNICECYNSLNNMTEGEKIEILMSKFRRGKFSIINILEKIKRNK